jgi:hypothetical protein
MAAIYNQTAVACRHTRGSRHLIEILSIQGQNETIFQRKKHKLTTDTLHEHQSKMFKYYEISGFHAGDDGGSMYL